MYKLLSDRQHAHRKGHCCEPQLTIGLKSWIIIENILDFQKAFDTPPHELLESKLFSYGIGGKTLKWIDSFLCFIQQRVVVNGLKSDRAPVLAGVPRASFLVPCSLCTFKWHLIRYWVWNNLLMTVFAIVKLRIKTQWNFRRILIDCVALQGNGVWDFKKTDQEDPCFIYLRGNWPWKRWKKKKRKVSNTIDLRWIIHM